MMQGKVFIVALAMLAIGFGAGFVLRPIIMPPATSAMAVSPAPVIAEPGAARGMQYFTANLDEARRVVAGCRDGSVRGDECANAQQAVTEAEGRDRFKKFMGH